jgi:hypothetical protein
MNHEQPFSTEQEKQEEAKNSSNDWRSLPDKANRWPLTQFSFNDMARLRLASNLTRKPMTQILRLAVHEYVEHLLYDHGIQVPAKEK